MERRNGRALLIVDIGVPRNVDPGAGEVFGVDLLDIDDLRAVGEQTLAQRRQEIGKVRDVIAEELDRYRVDRAAREAAPLVTALRARAEEIRIAELDRARARLTDLSPEAWDSLDALTRSVVNKLLHEPTVRIKDAAGTPRGDLYADALAELFVAARRRPRRLMPPLRVATRVERARPLAGRAGHRAPRRRRRAGHHHHHR